MSEQTVNDHVSMPSGLTYGQAQGRSRLVAMLARLHALADGRH